jgi:asparagine synthase (glutamine-hydrolysing)
MSALFGVIAKLGNPDPSSFHKIKQTIVHRNVDGEGYWKDEHAALGFMKMAVYPRQLNENLPLQEGDAVITADARIDNREELLSLMGLNHKQWEQAPDSTLILKAFCIGEKSALIFWTENTYSLYGIKLPESFSWLLIT